MVRIFKTRAFVRWAKKEKVRDYELCKVIREIQNGLIDADLGHGLIKKRIARLGYGKRRGYRVLVTYRYQSQKNAFFVIGFSKSKRGNIDLSEMEVYKKLSQFYLSLDTAQLNKLVAMKKLLEVDHYG